MDKRLVIVLALLGIFVGPSINCFGERYYAPDGTQITTITQSQEAIEKEKQEFLDQAKRDEAAGMTDYRSAQFEDGTVLKVNLDKTQSPFSNMKKVYPLIIVGTLLFVAYFIFLKK